MCNGGVQVLLHSEDELNRALPRQRAKQEPPRQPLHLTLISGFGGAHTPDTIHTIIS